MERSVHCSVLAIATAAVLACPVASFAWLDPAQPDVVMKYDSADDGFSAISSEVEQNFGARSNRRIKGHQDMLTLKFDLSAYAGQTVTEAELHLCRTNTDTVTSLAVSTFNTDWTEGSGNGDRTVGAPCYRWRITPASSSVYTTEANEWTYAGSDITTAAFGNFGSLTSYGFQANDTYKSYTVAGANWIAMKVDPAVIHALMVDQYGLTATDARWHSGSSGPNPSVWTQDQNNSVRPRLYLKFAATTDTVAPGGVADLTAADGLSNGKVVLHFDAPTDPQADKAFGYTIRYSTSNDFAAATNLARWRIPRPLLPGAGQKVLLEGLTPGQTYYFFVQAYDAVGNGSVVASTSLAPTAVSAVTLMDGGFATPDPAGKTVLTVPNVLRWWAASEVTRINPVTGNRFEDGYAGTGSDNYKKANVVWDAGTNTISLLSARNEIVGAQLIVEKLTAGALNNVSVSASNLTGPGGYVINGANCVELFQMFYLPSGEYYYADPAIPLIAGVGTSFNIPDSNRNPSGNNQAVWVDVYVPKDAPSGDYPGTLTVTAAQLVSPVTVNVAIHVSPVMIPDYPTFLVDLNGYGNPWNWGANTAQTDRITLGYFQTTHKHRVVPNTLPYGWNGNVQVDRVPDTMSGSGASLHATSWTTFDRRYGPLFDGSAFSSTNATRAYYGPGANTPITHFYSTFFESWPINMLDATYGFDALGLGGTYWYNLKLSNLYNFFLTLPDVWDAYTEGYKQAFRNVTADWVLHADAKGWTQTAFQTYHNHKYSYAGCAVFWVMEENDGADDFRADGFYHQLWRDGYAQANRPNVKWDFRIDISDRYGMNYGQLDNRINWWCLGSGAANSYWPQIQYRNYFLQPDKQEDWMTYSDSPSATGSGLDSLRISLRRWSQGYKGYLPYWENFSNTSWTGFGNPAATIYSGKVGGLPGLATSYEGCFLSMRVKQMRQAEQVVELLNLWADTNGMNRERVRDSVFAKYGTSAADYGFGTVDDLKLYRMRADLLKQLEAAIFIIGDIDNNKVVNVADLQLLMQAWNTQAGPPASPAWNANADLDNNGMVNIGDLQLLVAHWGESAS